MRRELTRTALGFLCAISVSSAVNLFRPNTLSWAECQSIVVLTLHIAVG
jgi:hypothetical protein